MSETNHYAHCSQLMIDHKKSHFRRLILLIGMLLTNFYTHVLTFGVKYSGSSLTSFYASQGDGRNKIAPVAGTGASIVMLIVCGVLFILAFRTQRKKLRIGLLIGAAALLLGIGLGGMHYQSQTLVDNGVRVSYLPYGMGMLTLLLSLFLIFMAWLGEPKRMWCYLSVIALLVIGIITDCLAWWMAGLVIVVFAIGLKQVWEARWLKTQPGYPQFNERFDEMTQYGSSYHATYRVDDAGADTMTDAYGDTVRTPAQQDEDDPYEAYKKRRAKREAQLEAEAEMQRHYRLSEAQEGVMQGVELKTDEEIAAEEAAAEAAKLAAKPTVMPDLPSADDIVMPTWNDDPAADVPDVAASFPETGSDFPDIAGDIPDLPEIPDIPKL